MHVQMQSVACTAFSAADTTPPLSLKQEPRRPFQAPLHCNLAIRQQEQI